MNMKYFLLTLTIATMLSGCSMPWSAPEQGAHALPYHENSVNSLALGRHYQTQGRFELARETFLNGLATSRDEEMRKRLALEIEATDRLILSQR
ncbi:hypothetical protein [Desulfovibrio ferrophilus]|uniref:Uncharacterized protein n=1 Tax=Desulfovibrio ferrophilus TaxID=241368 RepID=A0A2Z6AXA5_9BACT|nr:hypothetical protein [Desulfovibrio ferrophilus]BBD07884.1 uncharacterized protein DFE_1158 [Desulfovibrio ferrophilus]